VSVLEVPALERRPWPSLGGQVCELIESGAFAFGPGDLRGQPYRLDDEKRRLAWRIYEVYPREHPMAGRRRFRRVALSMRKGSAKTEFGAVLMGVELHPEGPVRCDGWRRAGRSWVPVGRPVVDPYIPMLAYTREQSDELAYQALVVMLSEGRDAGLFDIGLARIMRRRGDGRAVSLATAPDSRDGARTTCELFDETHRLVLPRQREAHRTMLANLPKRRLADAWSLEVTTAPEPGEGSVAEDTMTYARLVGSGARHDARLYFFHRQASDHHDLATRDGIRAAVLEASGPVAEWSDVEGIVDQWDDPTADRAYLSRVWLNRLERSTAQAFDMPRWQALARPDHVVPEGALVTLGFDGSRTHDHTALVACEVATGHVWPLAIWDPARHGGEIPVGEVEVAIEDAFHAWSVWRLYADPAYWESFVAGWAGRYGEERVIAWWTYRTRPMAQAIRGLANAIAAGEILHRGDPAQPLDRMLDAHIGAAHRRAVAVRDEDGEQMWVIAKERPDSEHRIDAAMATCLAWEARTDAVAAGVTEPSAASVYETRGLLEI
jgi:phage terminase large subunit-like protein